MRRGPQPKPVKISSKQRAELQLLKAGDEPKMAKRAGMILMCTRRLSFKEIAEKSSCTIRDVSKWRQRYLELGVDGLKDLKRQGRPTTKIQITEEQREILERYIRRGTVSQSLSTRARICLTCSEGRSDKEVAQIVGVDIQTVGKWRKRFIANGIEGLTDGYRPGIPRKITDDLVEKVVVQTLESKPKGAVAWLKNWKWAPARSHEFGKHSVSNLT